MLIGNHESDKKLNFTLVDKGDGNFLFKTVYNNKSFYLMICWGRIESGNIVSLWTYEAGCT